MAYVSRSITLEEVPLLAHQDPIEGTKGLMHRRGMHPTSPPVPQEVQAESQLVGLGDDLYQVEPGRGCGCG